MQPNLLEELYNSKNEVKSKLSADEAKAMDIPEISYINDEAKYRFDFNEDQMAVEKLRDGISVFAAAAVQLKEILAKKM